MASYIQRDHTPPPLEYPYKPFYGPIPGIVQDRLAFDAFKARSAGIDLAVFIVRAWEDFRYPHIKMLHVLRDHGYVRRSPDAVYGDSWSWVAAVAATRRSEVSSDDKEQPFCASEIGFFAVDVNQDFFASVEVAPKISAMEFTPR